MLILNVSWMDFDIVDSWVDFDIVDIVFCLWVYYILLSKERMMNDIK